MEQGHHNVEHLWRLRLGVRVLHEERQRDLWLHGLVVSDAAVQDGADGANQLAVVGLDARRAR